MKKTIEQMAFLVKVGYFMKNGRGVELIGRFNALDEARAAANNYEKKLYDKNYKREFCVYNESDGIHKGFYFTIF